MTPLIVAVGVSVFMAVAMLLDLRSRRLPNLLTVPFFLAGVTVHTVATGLPGLGFALGGFGVGFGILLVLWLIGGGGGGDVKMMGALGAWLGAPLTLVVFILSTLFAVFVSVGVILWRATSRAPATAGGPAAPRSVRTTLAAGRAIPYAVPVALAVWAVAVAKFIQWSNL